MDLGEWSNSLLLKFLLYNFFMISDIQKIFDNISGCYDRLNNIISFGHHLDVKIQAIKNVPLKSDFKILDLCTGTGDIAIYIAENIVKEGLVIGADFSEKMLEIARKKGQGIENLTFIEADALNLPFKDEEFDACFISFGLRNLTDLKKGLQEMKRVTKKGGFVVSLDMGKPKGIIGFFYHIFLFFIVPILGFLFSRKFAAYKYLPESTKKFPSPEKLVEIFEQTGFKNVQRHDFVFGAISEQIGEV